MKIKIIVFLLLCTILNSQNKKIEIIDKLNNPISEVGIFLKNKRITESDKHGRFEIENLKPNDSLFFVKSGFDNFAIQFKNIQSTIKLDSLRTMNIEEVVIFNYDAKTLLDKITNEGKKGHIYISPKNVSIYKHLNSKNKVFYDVDNNFFWKPKEGRFIENKDNVTKNFTAYIKTEGETDYLLTVCELNGDKFSLFPFKASGSGYYTAKSIPQLNDIIRDFEKYNFKTEKSEGKIILSFSPKENTKRVYLGRIIIDSEDFGIYEGLFNLVKNNKNRELTTIDAKPKSRRNFEIESERFVLRNKKQDGKYFFDYSVFDLSFRALDGKIKNEIFHEKSEVKSIDFINIDTSIPFDLSTFEFE